MNHRMRIFPATAAIGLLLALTAPAHADQVRESEPAPSVEPVSILLKGHDEPLEGYLREISPERYLLQGENYYHSFPADQIVSVNGGHKIPDSARGSGRLIFTTLYEKLLPGGDVEIWSRNEIANDSAVFLEGTDWGAAAWEKQELETLEVYDNYANRLPVRVIPKGDGSFRIDVTFLVPVAPGESMGLSIRRVRRGAAKLEDGTWTYTFNLDFNEDRYLTRKVELPYGAEVITPYRGCWRFEIEDRMMLISQHYYPAHTREPLTVSWKMP